MPCQKVGHELSEMCKSLIFSIHRLFQASIRDDNDTSFFGFRLVHNETRYALSVSKEEFSKISYPI